MPKKAKDSKKANSTETVRKLVAAVAIVFFAVIISLITFFAADKIDQISKDPLVFRDWIEGFGFWGKFVFVGLAALQVVLAVIPGGPVQIAAGYAFGIFEGSVWCTIGIQLGSAIAFLLARHLGMRVIKIFFSEEKIDSIKFLQNSKRLDFIVFVCFLIPGAPKDLLTYFCGITKIPFGRFMLLTTIARIPSIIFSVMSGNALVEQKYISALIIICALVLCSIAGFVIYKKLLEKESQKDPSSAESTDEQ
jgi:uncharacterized membrane protein YdjX (TVP38/TMEM64 family)